MALETCNASVSHDIDGAGVLFSDLKLETYPGENISDFTTEALRSSRSWPVGMLCLCTQGLVC